MLRLLDSTHIAFYACLTVLIWIVLFWGSNHCFSFDYSQSDNYKKWAYKIKKVLIFIGCSFVFVFVFILLLLSDFAILIFWIFNIFSLAHLLANRAGWVRFNLIIVLLPTLPVLFSFYPLLVSIDQNCSLRKFLKDNPDWNDGGATFVGDDDWE